MQKFYMCLLSCALLTGVTGYAAEDTEKPQKPAGKPSREFRPGGEFRPGQGMPGGFRAFRIDYGYNEAEQKLVSAEENKIRQAAEELAEELSIALEDAETLVANGFVTIDGLKAAETETLLDIPGIDAGVIADIIAKLGK